MVNFVQVQHNEEAVSHQIEQRSTRSGYCSSQIAYGIRVIQAVERTQAHEHDQIVQ